MVKHHLLRNRAVFTYVVLIATLSLSSIAHGGGVLFVDDDAPPGGDGNSWDSAYRFIADALVAAGKGRVGEIHVAQGVYQPDRDESNPNGTGDREATFQLINGVALMGGYAGLGAKDPDARDLELYESVLSGDLLRDDGPNFENNDENSFHVVRGNVLDQTAVLDGFTITAGNADGEDDQSSGGGMFNSDGASPTVSNCAFVANWSDEEGGGMYNFDDSSPTITDCTFNGNRAGSPLATGPPAENATFASGGGMYNSERSSPAVIGCTFVANVAGYGGGMTNSNNSSPTVIGCTFVANTAMDGGGMFNTNNSHPAVTDCIFNGNSAYSSGGGMFSRFSSNATVANCTFSENSAEVGGGMRNFFESNPTVTSCTFSDNSAESGGGMNNVLNSNPTVANCTFSGNSAEEGGGMANAESSPTVTDCTFTGNTAKQEGGGMRNGRGSSPAVTNSIVWGNANGQIDGGTITVRYSDVEGGYEGIGNIDTDPLFADPGIGDYRLSAGSPCIDAGNNWGVSLDVNDYDEDGITNELFPVDLDGNPRFNADEADFDPGCGVPVVVDMGAYEYQFDPVQNVIFADLNGDGSLGVADLLALLAGWGACAEDCCLADLDLDGSVGISDLLLLLASWE